MRVAPNWMLHEFVDPKTYKLWGDNSIWFIDPKIINIAQHLRERLGVPMALNTWYTGGQFQASGLRPPIDWKELKELIEGTDEALRLGIQEIVDGEVGASLSQHRFGRAGDIKILKEKNRGADIIRKELTDNFSYYKKLGLTTIESKAYAPTWCHYDVRETGMDTLKIVSP